MKREDFDEMFRCECGEFKFHTDSHCMDCLMKDPVLKMIAGEEE